MSLIKFNNRDRFFPFKGNGLRNFLNSDDFFNEDFLAEDSLMPAMNIKETKEDFEIEFAAPGFSKKDFEVSIDKDTLNVCGEKSKEKEDNEEGYFRREFSYNTFKRSLRLPENVNTSKDVKATYKDGILKLNLAKKEPLKVEAKKQIEVV